MNQNNDRSKYIKWTFLPIILVLCIDAVVETIATEGIAVYALATFKGTTVAEFYTSLVSIIMSPLYLGFVYIPYAVISIIVFGILYKKLFKSDTKIGFLKASGNKPVTLVGAVLFALGMQYVTMYLIVAIASAFPALFESYQGLMESAGFNDYTSIVITVYALCLGPIAEELVFRGLTFNSAKQYMPIPAAIALQAFLFGVFHKNMLQGIYACIFGLGLGYVMYLFDDIFLCILVHILFNIFGTYGSGVLPFGGNTIIGFFGWVLGSLILAYIALIILRKSKATVNNQDSFTDI
ncbi:CPBP family intramembrane glutamic endopeptidase [Pseudobutyrivibrio sp.]|uniref:CPBP family intramembrane glutamic endopeptidase n=1 Tax=Pseudobutyrivibrio sp. TaxID=2014367 RepID=UPI001D781809|nr:type II CAAX endopeptidase family protein [Pseudobutyrivibrio sp.]MBE5910473.1 CPBP family intramembrane metalloprotease [Pseudobutyrivibrio sp.]